LNKDVCCSEGLSEGDKEALGFESATTVEEALDVAMREAKVGVLTCGEVVPTVTGSKVEEIVPCCLLRRTV